MARVINRTEYPDDEVRRLVRVGMKGLNTKSVKVTVVPGRKFATGYARWGLREHVVLRVPPESAYPLEGWRRHRSSPWNHDARDWREAIVALAAHEGRHIDLWRNGVRHRSVQQIEMACEAWEHGVLKEYREKNGATA
jgi:hypothetical protein